MGKRRTPILDKVRRLIRISTPLSNTNKSGKKLKLLRRNYEPYELIQEYQFSPSKNNTPLFHITQRKNRDLQSVLEVMFLCLKAGFRSRDIRENEVYFYCEGKNSVAEVTKIAKLPAVEHSMDEDGDEDGYLSSSSSSSSVDERAERFIDKFYTQMRLQRIQPSLLLFD